MNKQARNSTRLEAFNSITGSMAVALLLALAALAWMLSSTVLPLSFNEVYRLPPQQALPLLAAAAAIVMVAKEFLVRNKRLTLVVNTLAAGTTLAFLVVYASAHVFMVLAYSHTVLALQ
jgi:hypothetical protein